jgi:hypothetical protein
VIFDESLFPFASLHTTDGARYTSDVVLLPDSSSRASTEEPLNNYLDKPCVSMPISLTNPVVQSQRILATVSDLVGGATGEADPVLDQAQPPVAPYTEIQGELVLGAAPGTASSAGVAPSTDSGPCVPLVVQSDMPHHVSSSRIINNWQVPVTCPSSTSAHIDVLPTSSVPAFAPVTSPLESVPASSLAPAPGPTQIAPRTRLQSSIRKPKIYSDGTIRYANFVADQEPGNLSAALADQNWKNAMEFEYS